MDEGNTDTISVKDVTLINLPKFRMMSQTVGTALQFRSLPDEENHFLGLEAIEPLSYYLAELPFLVEEELYALSLEREPRA